jgi:chemotaxis signal transduction protein
VTDPASSAPPAEGPGGPAGETAEPGEPGPGYPLLVFRAGDFRGGIPVGRVREVVRLRRLARIPDARPPFRGLLSVRGDIVTVVDLVGLQEIAAGRGGPLDEDTTGPTTGRIRPTRIDSVILLRGGKDPLGLEVDGVEDIRDFAPRRGDAPAEPAAIDAEPVSGPVTESTSPAVAPEHTRLWAGTVRDSRGELGVLDVAAVFSMAEAIAGPAENPPLLEVGDRG